MNMRNMNADDPIIWALVVNMTWPEISLLEPWKEAVSSVHQCYAVPGGGAASARETVRFTLCLRPQTAVAPEPNMRRDPLCEECTCV